MNKIKYPLLLLGVISIIVLLTVVSGIGKNKQSSSILNNLINKLSVTENPANNNPVSITYMRKQSYPGSELKIEEKLPNGSNYRQYIASYISQGLKIHGLLTVPESNNPPVSGWSVIIFNHGYIPPEQYKTTEQYVAYVDAFAKNGYIVFKPDYRGFGNSEGKSEGAYYSPSYTIDVLNAISSIKRYGVIWGGVVGTYDELLNKWRRRTQWTPSEKEIQGHIASIRENLITKFGTPKQNPQFWNSIDPRYFLNGISGPLQLHHGLADEEVPPFFSESLMSDLEAKGKKAELFTYIGADHNISGPSFNVAIGRSVEFFNSILKG